MFEELKIKKVARAGRNESTKVKMLLAIDKDVLRDLTRIKPRRVTRQEAIRQILEFYINEKQMWG